MVNIAIVFNNLTSIELVENEFYNHSVKEELENPKCDFVHIGDNIFRKSEINYILVEREKTK